MMFWTYRFARRALGAALLLPVLAACGKPAPVEQEAPPAGPPPVIRTETGEMAVLPAGVFTMGSAEGEDDEQPAHEVRLDAFCIDTREVTQEQFTRIMGRNPSSNRGSTRPVEQVTWADAALFCNARSRRDGLQPCYNEQSGACNFDATGYRLPTEAEWEYACRAGSAGAYSFGAGAADLPHHAWFADNAGGKPHACGTRRANAWGLYDMHGNVFEWCNDVYAADYYAASPEVNPRGPEEQPDSRYVVRGGGFESSAKACRSAARAAEGPGQVAPVLRPAQVGFRCVRKPPQEASS